MSRRKDRKDKRVSSTRPSRKTDAVLSQSISDRPLRDRTAPSDIPPVDTIPKANAAAPRPQDLPKSSAQGSATDSNTKKASVTTHTRTYSQVCRSGNRPPTPAGNPPHIGTQQRSNTICPEEILSGRDTRTTIMIRNVPSRYSQLALLHDLCSSNFYSLVDYIYLPLDVRSLCPLGYAFVNFVHPRHVADFYRVWNGRGWPGFNTDKICSLSYGRIQGRSNLLKQLVSAKNLLATNIASRPLVMVPEGVFCQTVSSLGPSHRRIDQISCSLLLFRNVTDPTDDRYIPIAFGDIPLLPFLREEEVEFLTATPKEKELWSEHFVYESEISQRVAEELREKLDYISTEMRRRPIRVKQQHIKSHGSSRLFHFSSEGIHPIPYPYQSLTEGNKQLLYGMESMSPFTILTLPHIMDVQTFFKYILSAVFQGNGNLEQSWSSASTNGSSSPVYSVHTLHSTPPHDHSPCSTSRVGELDQSPSIGTPRTPLTNIPSVVPIYLTDLAQAVPAAVTVPSKQPTTQHTTPHVAQQSVETTVPKENNVVVATPTVAAKASTGEVSFPEKSTQHLHRKSQGSKETVWKSTGSKSSLSQPLSSQRTESKKEPIAPQQVEPTTNALDNTSTSNNNKKSLKISVNIQESQSQVRHPPLPLSPIDSPRSTGTSTACTTPAASPVPAMPPLPVRTSH